MFVQGGTYKLKNDLKDDRRFKKGSEVTIQKLYPIDQYMGNFRYNAAVRTVMNRQGYGYLVHTDELE